MTDTPAQAGFKPKKSVALSGTVAGNTAANTSLLRGPNPKLMKSTANHGILRPPEKMFCMASTANRVKSAPSTSILKSPMASDSE